MATSKQLIQIKNQKQSKIVRILKELHNAKVEAKVIAASIKLAKKVAKQK